MPETARRWDEVPKDKKEEQKKDQPLQIGRPLPLLKGKLYDFKTGKMIESDVSIDMEKAAKIAAALQAGVEKGYAEVSKKQEKKETIDPEKKRQLRKRMVDKLVGNYTDDEGNLRAIQFTAAKADFPVSDIVDEEFFQLGRELVEGDELFDITDILVDKGMRQEIVERISSPQRSLREKVILIKLIGDINSEIIYELDFSLSIPKEVLQTLEAVEEDPRTNFFLKTFTRSILGKNLREVAGRFLYDEDYDKEFASFQKYDSLRTSFEEEFHLTQYDEAVFQFTDQMKTKINEDLGNDSYRGSLESVKLKASDEELIDYIPEKGEKIWYGDYIVSRLSPGLIGVYSTRGNLVGYQEDVLAQKGSAADKKEVEIKDFSLKDDLSLRDKVQFKEPENDILFFKLMLSLPFRREVKNQLGVDLAELGMREQYAFMNFLKNKSPDEITQIIDFIKQSPEKDQRINRMRAFLSVEFDESAGQEIIGIGRQLEAQPKVADQLFAQYAEMVDLAENSAAGVCRLYEEMFFEKKIEKEELLRIILGRASDLFIKADKRLKNSKDKEEVVTRILEGIREEQDSLKKYFESFKRTAKIFEQHYKKIYEEAKHTFNPEFKEYLKSLVGRIQSEGGDEKAKETIDALQTSEFLSSEGVSGKIDSYRLQKIIEDLKYFYSEAHDKVYQENKNNLPTYLVIHIARLKKESEPAFKPLVEQLERLLEYQKVFERKLEMLVYGHESAGLPEHYRGVIDADIRHYQVELPENEKLTYLPVGISSIPPGQEKVHRKPIDALLWLFWLNNQDRETKFLVVDTIQRHNYEVFPEAERPDDPKEAALENGRRDRRWYLAAKRVFQLENIQMSEEPGVSEYEELVETNPRVREYLEIISELEKGSPALANAIKNLAEPTIRERVSRGALDEEDTRKRLSSIERYGKEEMALILALNGQKIGHKKEIKYDILARIIPVYRELRSRMESIEEFSGSLESIRNRDQSLVELSLLLAFQETFSQAYFQKAKQSVSDKKMQELKIRLKAAEEAKDRAKVTAYNRELQELKKQANSLKGAMKEMKAAVENVKQLEYLEEGIEKLGLTKNFRETILNWQAAAERISQEDWFKEIQLPEFYYPLEITSLSFEASEKGEYIGFREPYSTYKGEDEASLAIQANQMIASTDPLAAAKILVLSEKNQRTYFNKVLRPLLVNYYISTNPSRELAQSRFEDDFKEINTLSEVIEFIQRKIIWPLEMELQGENSSLGK